MEAGGRSAARRLQEKLAGLLPMRVLVRVTDNLHTMLSFGRQDGRLIIRLHRMFLHAPDEVLEALARYVAGGDVVASSELDAFIDRHRWMIRRPSPEQRRRRFQLRTRGAHHDLGVLVRALERLYFCRPLGCAITWGAAPRVRLPRRSIKLGSYAPEARLIRIHPALDQPHVPTWFVGWIVFHELLHHHHGIRTVGGRRRIHTAEFLDDERRYAHYERARRWEKENLHTLLAWSPEPALSAPALEATSRSG